VKNEESKMQCDKVECDVKEVLEAVVRDWNTGQRFDWTAEIAKRLCALSKREDYGFGACSRGTPAHADYGEWLYDICWFEENDVCITKLPLVGECEWGPDGACDGDFQKLIQARAEHRLWLFQVYTEEQAFEMFDGCKKVVSNFSGSQLGDRYLFAALIWENIPQLICECWVH